MESDDLLNKKLNMSIPKAGNPTLRKAKSVRRKDLKEKHENDKDESSSSSEEEIMESDDLLTKKLNMSIQKAGNPTPKESATSLGGKEAHQPGKDQEDSSSSSEEEMMASEDLLTKKLNMSTPKEKETGKMAKWFRSEPMEYISLIMNEDAANAIWPPLGFFNVPVCVKFTN